MVGRVRHRGAIDALGVDRVMMGSDLPDNTSTEIAKIKALGLTPSQEKKVLGENAEEDLQAVLLVASLFFDPLVAPRGLPMQASRCPRDSNDYIIVADGRTAGADTICLERR